MKLAGIGVAEGNPYLDSPDPKIEDSVERYGLRVQVLRRPRVPRLQESAFPSKEGVPRRLGEKVVHVFVSTLLLAYFGSVCFVAIGGVAWLFRGWAR